MLNNNGGQSSNYTQLTSYQQEPTPQITNSEEKKLSFTQPHSANAVKAVPDKAESLNREGSGLGGNDPMDALYPRTSHTMMTQRDKTLPTNPNKKAPSTMQS